MSPRGSCGEIRGGYISGGGRELHPNGGVVQPTEGQTGGSAAGGAQQRSTEVNPSQMTTMGAHSFARITVIVLAIVVYIIGISFNALSAQGTGPFLRKTANVSDQYNTQITPAGWTFSIWGVIYFWLTALLIYIVTTIFRRNAYGQMYCSPAVLPYGFFISWTVNILFNIAWLLLWDRELMIGALILLALVAFTNYLTIFFSCHGLKEYGAWLSKYHNMDLWCIRVLVQNGLAVYATWTSIATLINLTIVVSYEGSMDRSDAATLSLSLLLVEVAAWFILETFVIDKHVRYILTVYPVIIVALSGNMTKNFDKSAPSRNAIFTAALLAVACVLFAVKVCLMVWRHLKRPFYSGSDGEEVASPMDSAEKQKTIFI